VGNRKNRLKRFGFPQHSSISYKRKKTVFGYLSIRRMQKPYGYQYGKADMKYAKNFMLENKLIK
jgi:hypothetical protein